MDNTEEEIKSENSKVNLNCRFYRQKSPKLGEVVMVQVLRMEFGFVDASLLEYNNIEGLLVIKKRSRIRPKIIRTRVGRREPMMVISLDENKGYLDLSTKHISYDDSIECKNKYNKGKSVNIILCQVACATNTDIERLYETIVWPLNDRYEHALDAFKFAVSDADTTFEGLDMTPEIRSSLINIIKERLAPPKTKISAVFSLTCFEYDGIDAIKEALTAGMSLSTSEISINIRLLAAPVYLMTISTRDDTQGLDLAVASLNRIAEDISNRGGGFILEDGPKVLNRKGEYELEEQIKKITHRKKDVLHLGEGYNETMGNADIGIDTSETDAKNEQGQPEDSEEDDEQRNR